MMLSEAARLAGGTFSGDDVGLLRVETDSRAVQAGDLFVALQGEQFDGHDFVADALARGAVGAIVAEHWACDISEARLIKVADPRQALGSLAAGWRARFSLPLFAITGSNGKTTVKDMLGSILAAHAGTDAVLTTRGNFNNDIGLPLTLLRLNAQHRYAVIEMGMNHAGELTYLSGLTRPDFALVNNAMRAHIGHFDSVAAIARAKAEIYAGLGPDGVAIFNAEDDNVAIFAEAAFGHPIVRFGLDSGDVSVKRYNLGADGSTVTLATPQGELVLRLSVPGLHNVKNALAATAMALAADIPASAITRGLMNFTGSKGRLQKCQAKNGAQILDDSYNANPDSMKAGIAVLARAHAPRWFVMGDMGELGEAAVQLHEEVGLAARDAGIETMLSLGELSRRASEAFGDNTRHFASLPELLDYLDRTLPANATVLVKGSHSMRMDSVVDHLLGKKGN